MEVEVNQSAALSRTKYPFEFNGKGLEFFGIWIVNLCLTIVTLGIYSAWAKVRTQRYFYGNTVVDDSAFEYLADPKDILKGRVIAVLLFGAYSVVNQFFPVYSPFAFLALMLVLPGIIVLSMAFRMRNSAYRGLTFRFARNFKHAYLVYGVPFACFAALFFLLFLNFPEMDSQTGEMTPGQAEAFLAFVSVWMLSFGALFLLFPVWDYFKSRFMVNNTGYGQTLFSFKGGVWSFVRIYIGAVLIFLIALLASFLAFALTGGFGAESDQDVALIDSFSAGFSFLIFPVYLYIFAYVQAYRLNTIFCETVVRDVRFHSKLTASYLFYLYITNSVAIVLSVGLLIPWAMVRTARYRAESLSLSTLAPLDQFIKQQTKEVSAVGEEVGEVFDLDIGL